ncbi:hypothetical protein [Mycolicibacterium chitae]|uniref:Uncharacterized protein n=1 Tax=Mycolicibacterium chitae TaxID=1792 RepID=A0A3S5EIG4_MYCCI|nr:hypothetical protein [Mycolicibacterium chitae]MCV7104220.1 hypothetical protein [Mycolicibacterium chitae]VEG48513.1 Uncharacterised protein [Mycolicibacterium chitae]
MTTTPNDLPQRAEDALRLARLNLRTRFQKLASSTKSMDVETIEIFHDALDAARSANREAR